MYVHSKTKHKTSQDDMRTEGVAAAPKIHSQAEMINLSTETQRVVAPSPRPARVPKALVDEQARSVTPRGGTDFGGC